MKLIHTLMLGAALAVGFGGAYVATPGHAQARPQASYASTLEAAAPVVIDEARDTALAEAKLAELAAEYDYLDGVTVTMGPTPLDKQAVAYYTEGQIVIDPAHTASVDEILEHEFWHVIDWRDNGRMDWGENLPPATAATYRTR